MMGKEAMICRWGKTEREEKEFYLSAQHMRSFASPTFHLGSS
jgi:hypothetical protein